MSAFSKVCKRRTTENPDLFVLFSRKHFSQRSELECMWKTFDAAQAFGSSGVDVRLLLRHALLRGITQSLP